MSASTTRAIEVFNDALEREGKARDAFVADACGGDDAMRQEVESLLAVHDAAADADFMKAPAIDVLPRLTEDLLSPPSLVGRRIGPYKVRETIGEGGMGVVYRAEQELPRRFVALKVMRPGVVSARMLRRFEHEVEVLGRLQHPGIARIYEAGTADLPGGPQPYFAMELVAGEPLTAYAEAQGLDTRARLKLMARVCDAVQHAHQHGVVHRDLKPGNILVDASGRPRILDFGVARATDSDAAVTTLQTDVRDLVGTLQYMSPEQCDADPTRLDTRSDVYSLGVIFYELLAGAPPYDVADMALTRALTEIRESAPRPLSSVNRIFRGDIDTIVTKALEKDPRRRYQSASELGADIRRYLAHEPIAARRPSRAYQLRRFARRNRVLVGGVAATMIVLCAGVVAASVLASVAREEARRRQVVLEFISKNAAGTASFLRLPENELLLDRVVASLDFEMTPELELLVHDHIGMTYVRGGRYEKAEPHTRRLLELARQLYAPLDSQTLRAVQIHGDLLNDLGKYEDARRLLEPVIEAIGEPRLPEQKLTLFRLLRLQYTLAGSLHGQGRLDAAESLYRRILARQAAEEDLTPSDPLETKVALATLLMDRGDLAEANELFRDALSERIELSGIYDAHTMRVRWLRGRTLLELERPSEARVHLDEALGWYEGKKGNLHPVTIAIRIDTARVLEDEGRLEDARVTFELALASVRQAGLDEWRAALHRVPYGTCLASLGDASAAQRELAEAHAALVARFGEADYRARRAEAALERTRREVRDG